MTFKSVHLIACVVAMALGAAPGRAAPTTDAAVVREARRALDASTGATGPGAAVLIARGDHILYREARGRADLELGVPLAPDHLFRIASVTKMFTAALILRLDETGALALDDPLSRFLPDFPNGGNITIRQLLSHTAGISDRAVDPQPGAWRRDLTMAEQVREIARRPPSFAPGTNQGYSNAGYILLGAVIEAATHQSWCDAMRTRLFAPLELVHTGCDTDAITPGRVLGYETDGLGAPYRNASFISMTVPASAGALVSSVDDLGRWMRALAGGRVVSPAHFREMATPAAPPGQASAHPYGFGMYIWRVRGETMIGHTGEINGFASILAYLPAQDITIVALANDESFDARTFGHRLAGIALGQPYPLVTGVAIDAGAMAALAGAYRIGRQNIETLSVRDGRLYAQRTNRNAVPLQMSADGRLFFVPDELSYFAPVRDGAGHVTALDYFDNGEGPPQRWPRVETAD